MRNKNQIPEAPAEPEFLIADEVSQRLRLPLSTVYHLAKTGAIPAIQLGRAWRFPAYAIFELSQCKPTPATEKVAEPGNNSTAINSESKQFLQSAKISADG